MEKHGGVLGVWDLCLWRGVIKHCIYGWTEGVFAGHSVMQYMVDVMVESFEHYWVFNSCDD